MGLTYSIITPARDEAETLPRLAESLARQTRLPERWVIVENGSSDGTRAVSEAIVETYDWVQLLVLGEIGSRERGAPIVRAIHAGIEALGTEADVIVNVDADVTIEGDYFERLLEAFEREPSLGIASGSAWEPLGRRLAPAFRHGRNSVGRDAGVPADMPDERAAARGASRLGRNRPAEGTCARLGDEDAHRPPFRHHRTEGSEDGSSWAHWLANGDTAHFMGYRPWYLLARTLHRARRDPAAIGLIAGYAAAAARRSPRLDDPRARAVLRDDQSLRQDPSPST